MASSTHLLARCTLLLVLVSSSCSDYIEVPAVVKVPQEVVPEWIELPIEHPVWDGPTDTLGILLGDTEIWEEDVVTSGFQLVIGVAGNSFRDPTGMDGSSNSLYGKNGEGLYLKVESSLSPSIFEKSLAGNLHESQPRPFYVTASTKDCPGDTMCRISIVFTAIPDFALAKGDEHVTIEFGPALLEKRTTKTARFGIVIKDDAQKANTIQSLSDSLEIVVASSLLFGSSQTAATSSARHLLLLHMKCGEKHNALDHATNPAEYAQGDGPNSYYRGGLVVNLCLGFIPVLVHLTMVVMQWKCSSLSKTKAASPHHELITAGDEPEARCFGVTITEFRQLQASVRYPHYSSLFLVFAFQGVATCSWRLVIQGETVEERVIGVIGLLFFNLGGMFFAWWKLGKGERRRMGAVFVTTGEEKVRWKHYLLGAGEWVSSTRRRLVHCYAILFECYREGCTRFLLMELGFNIFFALMGTLDSEGWNTCIIEFALVAVALSLFLAICVWTKPWASKFDNHAVCLVTSLQLLAMLLFIVSFFMKDIANTVHEIAEYIILIVTCILIGKAFCDVVLLVWDTCSGRRWRLQETFEQGQTLYQGRDCYVKTIDNDDDPNDKEGVMVLKRMAPMASTAYVEHFVPPSKHVDDDEESYIHDPFEHTENCMIEEGILLLTKRGAKQDYCPCCHSQKLEEFRKSSKPPSEAASERSLSWSVLKSRKKRKTSNTSLNVSLKEVVRDVQKNGQKLQQPLLPKDVQDPLQNIDLGAVETNNKPPVSTPSRRKQAYVNPQQSAPVSTHGDWLEYVSPEGVSYFHNTRTNETSWAPPLDVHDRYEP